MVIAIDVGPCGSESKLVTIIIISLLTTVYNGSRAENEVNDPLILRVCW